MQGRPEVENAANRREVDGARAREKQRLERTRSAYLVVMATVEGRAVMWDIIARAGVFETPWNHHSMEIFRNIGRHDYGRELMADVIELDEGLYIQMEIEARAQARLDRDSTDAAHTKRAAQEGEQS
jgi:hypothetical protein